MMHLGSRRLPRQLLRLALVFVVAFSLSSCCSIPLIRKCQPEQKTLNIMWAADEQMNGRFPVEVGLVLFSNMESWKLLKPETLFDSSTAKSAREDLAVPLDGFKGFMAKPGRSGQMEWDLTKFVGPSGKESFFLGIVADYGTVKDLKRGSQCKKYLTVTADDLPGLLKIELKSQEVDAALIKR